MATKNGECIGSMVSVRSGEQRTMRIEYNDAGSGIKDGNCVTRAFAIASGRPYGEVAAMVDEIATRERTGKRKRGRSSARRGVYKYTIRKLAEALGFTWTPTMHIGSGCTVHVDPWEVPDVGAHVLNLSKHAAALIDGVVYDTSNPARGGTRCVYGYWSKA